MKKVFTTALALAMAVGMSMPAFAANDEISNMQAALSYNGSTGEVDLGDVFASDELEIDIPLQKKLFLDKDGKAFPTAVANNVLTASEIRKSKIAVRTTIRGGSKVLKKAVSIDSKKGQIDVDFATEWVSTHTEDFEILVYLTIDGKRMDDYGITFTGTFGNEEIAVYADYDYVDLSRGYVAVAEEFAPKIEVDLGNGVSIFTKFFKDKKYYGTASREDDETALTVYAKYPDVDNVVILKSVGLNSTGDVVKLDTDYSDYYIYDSDMKYLGQASEMLPFSTRYYLANRKLETDVDEPEPEADDADDEDDFFEDDDDDVVLPPNTGGDGTSTNYNSGTNNPDTGASGLLSIAVLAAAVSLAGIAINRKKK